MVNRVYCKQQQQKTRPLKQGLLFLHVNVELIMRDF